jgi:HlyD family secretion protein
MPKIAPRWLITAAAGLLVLALLAAFFAPRPLEVETAPVRGGAIEETVSDQGVARVRQPFVISAPVGGRVERILLEVGDPVVAGRTVAARLRPAAAEPLDPRSLAQAQAGVSEAEAALQAAVSDRARLAAEADRAARESERTARLGKLDAASTQDVENTRAAALSARSALAAGAAEVRARAAELRRARSALTGPDAAARGGLAVVSPASGVVTRLLQQSERVVPAGTPLVEVGARGGLEAQVEFLSQDAVRIRPGMRAEIYDWGGPRPLAAIVRLVEPQGFTKISALGVEEQRVLVMLQFSGPAAERASLGPGYRLYARVILRRAADAVLAPLGALVRDSGGWAVWRIEGGRARLRPVRVGAMDDTDAEILSGLKAGDLLVAYPSDKVREGRRVKPARR